MSPASTVVWSREEEKSFENAIALHWEEQTQDDDASPQQWDTIASMVPSKSLDEIKHHYRLLAQDVSAIEAGHVPLPTYLGEEASSSSSRDHNHHGGFSGFGNKRSNCGFGSGFSGMGGGGGGHDSATGHGGGGGGKGGSRSEQERKKGIPWTEEEHKLFLVGLEKFGKGDWRSISRNFVVTRTPTQVASHAQKYFIRLNSMNRDRRRSSIHDITSINGSGGDVSTQQPPITGQQTNPAMNPANLPAIGPPLKHRPPLNMPGMGMYGAPMGHPVAGPGHMGSAVGTPVMLPPGGHHHHHHHHPPYVVPMAYPMAPPPMHQ